jgi:hypothetical protein
MKLRKKFNFYFIYLTKNLFNGHSYIGFHATNKNFDRDKYVGSGIDPGQWKEKEKYWIEKLKTHVKYGNGYNLTNGGDGAVGRIISEDTKKKISKATIGENNPMYNYQYNEDQIKRFKELNAGQNNPQYGKNISKKHKKIISFANKGRIKSEKTKQKIGIGNKGKIRSEELRNQISEKLKGRKLSEEKIKKT